MKILVVATIGLCGACGGGGSSGDDFIGVYSTTSHTSAQSTGTPVSCAAAGTPVTDARPYFKIEVDPFFMSDDLLTIVNCTDAAGTDCDETLVTLSPKGDTLDSEAANTQTGGGTMCNLYYSRSSATLSGATVHVEDLEKFESPDVSSDQCTLDLAEALADSPDCRQVERWDGTKLR